MMASKIIYGFLFDGDKWTMYISNFGADLDRIDLHMF
jgi:hypothetical protein